jgi:hypothetical protein
MDEPRDYARRPECASRMSAAGRRVLEPNGTYGRPGMSQNDSLPGVPSVPPSAASFASLHSAATKGAAVA